MNRTELLTTIGVTAGCALGGLLRYWCSGSVDRALGGTFPWGTMTVNVTGSLLIGVFASVSGPDGRYLVSPLVRQTVMVGVFGGFTTFSSFSIQTLALAQDGDWRRVAANVFLSVTLCLGGVWAGWQAGAVLNR
jgi:CrcB protein